MDGLFTDPNCSLSPPWAAWLAHLAGASLRLDGLAAEPGLPEAQAAQRAEDGRLEGTFGGGDRKDPLVDKIARCT